jgi:hypothetical protein
LLKRPISAGLRKSQGGGKSDPSPQGGLDAYKGRQERRLKKNVCTRGQRKMRAGRPHHQLSTRPAMRSSMAPRHTAPTSRSMHCRSGPTLRVQFIGRRRASRVQRRTRTRTKRTGSSRARRWAARLPRSLTFHSTQRRQTRCETVAPARLFRRVRMISTGRTLHTLARHQASELLNGEMLHNSLELVAVCG